MADRDDFESIYADYFPIRKPLAVAPERYTPPTHLVPPKQAELKPAYRPGDTFSAANPDLEQLAAELGDSAYHGDWRNAAVAGAGIASSLAQGKVRQGKKPPRADVYRPSMHDPNQREKQGPGFYSHMLAELKDMERGGRQQGNAAAWLKELQRAQVKPEEIAGSKIDQYLAEQQKLFDQGQRGPITRAELVEYARVNQPMIEEKRFGGHDSESLLEDARKREIADTRREYEIARDPEDGLWYAYLYGEPGGDGSKSRNVAEQNLMYQIQDSVARIPDKELISRMPEETRKNAFPQDVEGPLKWGGEYGGQDLVLDPSNPKNREYVLGLQPSQRQREIEARLKELEKLQYGYSMKVEPEAKAAYETRGREYEALQKELHGIRTGQYNEGHFPEVADYLGHGRGGEYMTAEGDPVWHIDEIQNTRAQKIRDEGSIDPSEIAQLQKRVDDAKAAQQALMDRGQAWLQEYTPGAVQNGFRPSGPAGMDQYLNEQMRRRAPGDLGYDEGRHIINELRKTDPAIALARSEQQAKLRAAPGHPLVDDMSVANRLGIRHTLLQTKDKDVSGLTLTPGDLQNERYNLSTVIPSMEVGVRDDAGRQIWFPPSGESGMASRLDVDPAGIIEKSSQIGFGPGDALKGKHIDDVLGADWGRRVRGLDQSKPRHVFDTPDLEVGGQGMRDYYDRQYPETLNKELKRLDPGYPGQGEANIQREGARVPYTLQRGDPPVDFHHFPLTPKAKDEIKKGLPFYSVAPLGIAGAAGSWLDPQYSEDADIGFAEGGDIDTEDIINKMRAMAPDGAVADTPRLPSDRFYDYSLTDPTREQWQPPRRDPGEIKLRSRPEGWDMAGNEGLARNFGQSLYEGDWPEAAVSGSGLVSAMAGVGAKKSAKLPAKRKSGEAVALPAVLDLPSRSQPPMKPLEQFVEELNQRPSAFGKNFYDRYLLPKDEYIPESLLKFESQVPSYKNTKVPQNVEKVREAFAKSKDNLEGLADQGLYAGLDGRPVNPWYWPIWTKLWEDRLGDKGYDLANKWAGYNAVTSMQTEVPRNQLEAFMLYHHDLNDLPFKKKLSNAELTGKAFQNKMQLAGEMAEGEGIKNAVSTAPKIGSYWPSLMGASTEPHYVMGASGKFEPATLPVVLDSIMSREIGYHDDEGKGKRLVGPAYAEAVRLSNEMANDRGAAPGDWQAGVWGPAQRRFHAERGPRSLKPRDINVYFDPFTRMLDDNVLQIAKQEGVAPEKVLDELIEGRRLPPNFWHDPGSFGKAEGGAIDDNGGWTTIARSFDRDGPIRIDAPGEEVLDRPDLMREQLEHAPLTYPLSPAGDDWTGLADSVDNRWMNNFAKDDRLAQYDANVADEAIPYEQKFDRMMQQVRPIHELTKHLWAGPGPRESTKAYWATPYDEQLASYSEAIPHRAAGGDVTTADILPLMHSEANPTLDRGRVPTYLPEEVPAEPPSAWRSAANAYAALGNEWLGRMPSTFGNVLTGRNPSDANAEREDALSYGRRADLPGFRLGTELLDNPVNPANPQMWLAPFIGAIGAKRLADAKIRHADDWGGRNRLFSAEQEWLDDARPLADTWKDHGWAPRDTFGVPPGKVKAEAMTWLDTPNLRVNEDAFQPMIVGSSGKHWTAEGKLPDLMFGLDEARIADPNLDSVTAHMRLDPTSKSASGVAGANFVYKDNVKRIDSDPIGMKPSYMRLEGNNFDELNALAPHELDHLVGYSHNLTPRANVAQGMDAIRGTMAERTYHARVKRLNDQYVRALQEYGPESAEAQIAEKLMLDMYEKERLAPSRAHYLDEPTEKKARAAWALHTGNAPPGTYPGDIDTYMPGAMGWRHEKNLQPAKLSDFASETRFDVSGEELQKLQDMYEAAQKSASGKAEGGRIGEGLTDPESIARREPEINPYWVPKPQPVGEIKNLPERYNDPVAGPLARQLSPTMGAYDAAQFFMDAYHDFKEGDYPELGYKAPLAAGMFVGPRGIGKIRRPDDWGGANRLKAANREFKRGDSANMSPQQIWNEYGWMHPNAWGEMAPNAVIKNNPSTIIATPEFGLSPRAIETIMRNAEGSSSGVGGVKSKLGSLYQGLDDFFAVTPKASNLSTTLTLLPGAAVEGGVRMYPKLEGVKFRDSIATGDALGMGQQPKGFGPISMRLEAPDIPGLITGGQHEITHIGQAHHHTPGLDRGPAPLGGTPAEHHFRRLLTDENATPEVRRGAENILGRLPGLAGYFNAKYERAARVRSRIGNATEQQIREGQVPSEMDAFSRHPRDTLVSQGMMDKYGLQDWMFDPKRSLDNPPASRAAPDRPMTQGELDFGKWMYGDKADGGEVQGYEEGGTPKKQAELKNYDPSWLDSMYYKINDEVFGKHATARDLDTTKKYTNAAIAALPVPTRLLHGIPMDSRISLAAAMFGAVPARDYVLPYLNSWLLPHAAAKFAEPITDVADPKRQYEPTQRESRNTSVGSDGKWSRQDWETAMYGQEGEPGFDTAMLAGPRERTPANINLDRVLADSDYAIPTYPRWAPYPYAIGGFVPPEPYNVVRSELDKFLADREADVLNEHNPDRWAPWKSQSFDEYYTPRTPEINPYEDVE